MKVNIYDIKRVLEGNNYLSKYNIFSINSPKYRIVMSLNIKDKIINHYVARYILIKKLDKYLDIRNCATRKNMGYDTAIKLLIKYLNKFKNNGKFFYNINHDVLKRLIIDKLDSYEYKIVSSIIDSTNDSYINNKVLDIKNNLIFKDNKRKDKIDSIPIYEYGRRLPIGNMTSQFLSIYYLYKLDHYIVNDLKLKYMVRYMDDYVILCKSKEYLKYALSKIIYILDNDYKLKVNRKKTFITSSYNCFEYLGYNYKIINNKIYISIKSDNRKRRDKNINKNHYLYINNLISYSWYFNSMNNYINSYKYCN